MKISEKTESISRLF